MKKALRVIVAFAVVTLSLTIAAVFAFSGLYSAIEDMGALLAGEIDGLRGAIEARGEE